MQNVLMIILFAMPNTEVAAGSITILGLVTAVLLFASFFTVDVAKNKVIPCVASVFIFIGLVQAFTLPSVFSIQPFAITAILIVNAFIGIRWLYTARMINQDTLVVIEEVVLPEQRAERTKPSVAVNVDHSLLEVVEERSDAPQFVTS